MHGVDQGAARVDVVAERGRPRIRWWVGVGVAAMVVVALGGGGAVATWAFEHLEGLGVEALTGTFAVILDFVSICPIAVIPAVAGVSATRFVYERRTYGAAVIFGAVAAPAAAVFWVGATWMTLMASRCTAVWVFGMYPGTYDHFAWEFLPTERVWVSLVTAVVLGLVVVAVHVVAGLRGGDADGAAQLRQALIGDAVVFVVSVALMAVWACSVYRETFAELGVTVH